jgi:3-methylcrotonyl-CoA carboxylase beta subunit
MVLINTNAMDLEFNKNDDKMRLLISQMEQRLIKNIFEGGGKKRIDKASRTRVK